MSASRDDGSARAATRIPKPWGYELLFARTPRYAGKILFIRAGEALSLQFHRVKEESIFVQSGRLKLQIGEPGQAEASPERMAALRDVILEPGESWHVPALTVHRFIALEDTHLCEVSTPELDDVVRLEDRYGRTGTSSP
jgi:mannose-6-phosphate isomerase